MAGAEAIKVESIAKTGTTKPGGGGAGGLLPNNFGKKEFLIEKLLWNDCLETRLESDVRSRIIGCQAQMKKSDFSFGLDLGQRIFSHRDNLSETLQKAGMSATSGQRNAKLTKVALKKIRNDDCFATFYQTDRQCFAKNSFMFILRSLRYQETKELLVDLRLELERLCFL